MRIGLLLVLVAACGSTIDVANDPQRWDGLKEFPYDQWASVLTHFVDDEGRVDYDELRNHRHYLVTFVGMLSTVGPTQTADLFPTREDRLAYWINAYNACTLHQVIRRWPIESVADRKMKFFYWTKYVVDGRELSLYQIENDIVRKQFNEPRIHFALNCASVGCPRLPAEPFLPATLEDQLERETQRFLAEPRNVAVEDGTLVLSEIFDWYAEDFEPDPRRWLESRMRLQPSSGDVRYREYDWTLNAQPAGP